MRRIVFGGAVIGLMTAVSGPAVAQDTEETWLVTGSGSGAAPVSEQHADAYDVGATGGLGLYRSIVPQFQLGARLDGGALPNDEARTGDAVDQDTLGLGALSAALRFRPLGREDDVARGTGLYLEAAGGPGVLESDVRAFLAPGAGYIFPVGELGIGPTARYIHVLQPDEETPAGEDVQIATFGIEVVVFDERPPRYEPPARERPVPEPRERLEPAARLDPDLVDSDGDGIPDYADSCDLEPETYNAVNDHDGCPDTSELTLKPGDKVVIDEKAFFAYDESDLRPEGEKKLDDIVAQFRLHGATWLTLRVQGHADRRGPMPYNEALSRRRAQAVKDYLVDQGLPPRLIEIEAYGETRPAVPDAQTEEEFQRNRRVEFEVVRP